MKLEDITTHHFEDIHRLGKPTGNNIRPVRVELITKKVKKNILKNAKLLKNSRIFIEEDFTREVLEERKILKPHFLQARNKGHKVSLNQNVLYINGEKYTAQDLVTDTDEVDKINDNAADNELPTAEVRRLSTSLHSFGNLQEYETSKEDQSNSPIPESKELKPKETPKSQPKRTNKVIQPKAGPLDKHIQIRLRSQTISKN